MKLPTEEELYGLVAVANSITGRMRTGKPMGNEIELYLEMCTLILKPLDETGIRVLTDLTENALKSMIERVNRAREARGDEPFELQIMRGIHE